MRERATKKKSDVRVNHFLNFYVTHKKSLSFKFYFQEKKRKRKKKNT